MYNREHEEKTIKTLLNELSKRDNFIIEDIGYPEKLKPTLPNPIDTIYFTDKSTYVIEHTYIFCCNYMVM